jgi:hypothetical protein
MWKQKWLNMCVWKKSDENVRYKKEKKKKNNVISCLISSSNLPLKNDPK